MDLTVIEHPALPSNERRDHCSEAGGCKGRVRVGLVSVADVSVCANKASASVAHIHAQVECSGISANLSASCLAVGRVAPTTLAGDEEIN